MIGKKINISLDSSWVLAQRDLDVLPIDSFICAIMNQYGTRVSEMKTSLTDCSFVIQLEETDASSLMEKMSQIISEHLHIVGDISEVAEITVYDISPKAENADERKISETSASIDSEKNSTPVLSQDAGRQDADQKPREELSAADKIHSLIGAEAFKSLAGELSDVAPLIVKNQTQSSFMIFSYLFAVNDGFGCSTYVQLFTTLLGELSLIALDPLTGVIEKVLPPPCKENTGPSLDDFFQSLNFSSRFTRVFCFDISEWLSLTSDKRFRSFLLSLRKMQDRAIFIFRVPFLEKPVLKGLQRVLNDIFVIREVAFIPLNQKQLREFARKDLKIFGYAMQKMAWEVFDTRIAEEKSDGKFYGIHTVDKIVKEMVYLKQRSCIHSGSNSSHIKRSEIISLAETMDRDYKSGTDMLNSLIGIDPIREKMSEIIAQVETAFSLGHLEPPCLHMRFIGNAGTGKTTVARIIGKIFKEKGILRNGSFFEYSGRDLCGTYVGETAPKTAGICRDAYGSVLFIDEAYTLYNGVSSFVDYGREALSTLLTEMENHRSDLLVIMAGYPDEMDVLLKGNPGIESRVPYVIEFPNYSRDDLYRIFLLMAHAKFPCSKDLPATAKKYFDSISDETLNSKEFSNARFVRNLFERTWGKAAVRIQFEPEESIVLLPEDFTKAILGNEFENLISKKEYKIGFI